MKPMLTEKDINIFTIVKDKNNISPLRQWCIDSWHKCMPNANIMIFDDKDLTNPNWKYYDVIKNDKLWNWYLFRPKNIDACNNDIDIIENKKLPDEHLTMAISKDSIRIRLLRAIPNALYMDSDAYLNISSKEFLELCNKYGDFILNSYHGDFKNKNLVFSISEGYFAGAKNVFLNNIIEYYDKLDITTFTGDVEINIQFISNTNYLKEYDNIGLINQNLHHVIHLCCSTLAYNKNHFLQKKIKKINFIVFKNGIYKPYGFNSLPNQTQFYYNKIKQYCKSSIDEKTAFIFCINGVFEFKLTMDKSFIDTNDYYVSMFNLNIGFSNQQLYKEFITKLKETLNIYFKPVLDTGKTINYYELNNVGDNPCLLKKI